MAQQKPEVGVDLAGRASVQVVEHQRDRLVEPLECVGQLGQEDVDRLARVDLEPRDRIAASAVAERRQGENPEPTPIRVGLV